MREAFLRILDIVLRTNGENNTSPLQVLYIPLEVQKGLADRVVAAQNEVLHTIVAHDPAPKCIVQVQNQTLLGFSVNGLHNRRNVLSQGHRGGGAQSHVKVIPVGATVPIVEAY